MGFKVYDKPCANCLLSKDRIVSPQAAKGYIQKCAANQSHFICHKATIREEEVCCKTFYDKLGYKSQMVRISQRLGMIEEVPQPDSVKLPTWEEMRGKKIINPK